MILFIWDVYNSRHKVDSQLLGLGGRCCEKWLLMGIGLLFWQMKMFLNRGDGCTILWIQSNHWTIHFTKVTFMACAFYLIKAVIRKRLVCFACVLTPQKEKRVNSKGEFFKLKKKRIKKQEKGCGLGRGRREPICLNVFSKCQELYVQYFI